MAQAAFFDLDRTVLHRASGPVINEVLTDAGLVPDRGAGLGRALYRFYDLVGETLPSMALARAAARFSRGWPAETVRRAGKQAAEKLDRMVAPYARSLIAQHRGAGQLVVLATTTPRDLVAPFAERLGFDDVVATRYAERDGAYTGLLEGEFVWSIGKLAAVRRWAREHDVSLAESFAYSDSFFDLPLLSAVGHPVAVNPDPRLLAFATIRRWPVLNLDVPPGVPKLAGVEPMDVLRWLAHPGFFPYARFDIGGREHIPQEGPGIIVANHRSYFDTIAIGLTVLGAGRNLRFLGKKEVFEAPVVGPLARAAGGIRVDRGTGSAEPLRQAAVALDAGELVALMPQGTIPRGREFFDPHLKGRPGAARLAAMSGAPVIPVGLWGTEEVWPRRARLPRVANVVNPPTVTVRVGPAVSGLRLGAGQADAGAGAGAGSGRAAETEADTRLIMEAITALLPPEARRRRRPTPEQIAQATPPGHPVDA